MPITEVRRKELVSEARKYRLMWALEASDDPILTLLQYFNFLISALPIKDHLNGLLDFILQNAGLDKRLTMNSLTNIFDLENLYVDGCDFEDPLECYEQLMLNYSSVEFTKLSAYDMFINKLLHPAASEIVKTLQIFIRKIEARLMEIRFEFRCVRESDHIMIAEDIHTFLGHASEMMHANILWKEDGASTGKWDEAVVALEKFVFRKLYLQLVQLDDTEDCQSSSSLHRRIQQLHFLLPKHLDVPDVLTHDTDGVAHEYLEAAKEGLRKLHEKECPADKILAIKQCCINITQSIQQNHRNSNNNNNTALPSNISSKNDDLQSATSATNPLPGADDILPMMILVIKDVNPKTLYADIKFLQRYTPLSRLVSESGYLLTQFYSAAKFLETAEARSITIPPAEFEEAMNTGSTQTQSQAINSSSLSAASKSALPASSKVTHLSDPTGVPSARSIYCSRTSHSRRRLLMPNDDSSLYL